MSTTTQHVEEPQQTCPSSPESMHETLDKDKTDDETPTMTATSVEKMTVDESVAVVTNDEKVADESSEHAKNVQVGHASGNVVDVGDCFDGVFSDDEKKALVELKSLLRNAIDNGEFSTITTDLKPNGGGGEAEIQTVEQDEAPSSEPAEQVFKPAEQPEPEPEPESDPKQPEEVKKMSIDEDGAKTVEAIEETIISTVPPSPKHEHSQGSTTERVSIWGVPLLQDERTDTILWKFLRAREFKVKEALTMLKNTLHWRAQFKVDELIHQHMGEFIDLDKYAFMHGVTKEGHPVCYNVYGVFQNKEIYHKTFSDEMKRDMFLKWRVQLMEKSVRKLDFSSLAGVSTIVQVNDLKDSPGPGKWELRQATKQALHLFQDNYPEFVAKQVFINVPWWYMAVNKMISPFLTQRTKGKFVVAGPSKSAETLFNYISPEQVPVQYGGLSKEGEFGIKDGATQIIVKPSSKEVVEFAVTEACNLTWEMRVLGWEVSYGAEFVPNAKESYTVIIQKLRKVGATQESIITNSFKTSEPGKIVLTVDNSSSKKKRLLYRLKSTPRL